MNEDKLDLTDDQWRFLSILEALGEPISIDVINHLAPIRPGALLDLIKLTAEKGWLIQGEQNRFSLSPKLPAPVRSRINALNTPEQLSILARKLEDVEIRHIVGPGARTTLLEKSDQPIEAAQHELDLSLEATQRYAYEESVSHLRRAITILLRFPSQPEGDTLFIKTALSLLGLLPLHGGKPADFHLLLQQARNAALRLENRRSLALVDLAFGMYFLWVDKVDEALKILEEGLKEVEALGDDDIMAEAAQYHAIYYHIMGMYNDAAPYFESALHTATTRDDIPAMVLIAHNYGYCCAMLGQYHRAIGLLDGDWRRAQISKYHELALLDRALLGVILIMARQNAAAKPHIQAVLKADTIGKSTFAYYIAYLADVYTIYGEGRVQEAYHQAYTYLAEMEQVGFHTLLTSRYPWFLEMVFDFAHRGYESLPGINLQLYLNDMVEGRNIFLKGLALRMKAREALMRGDAFDGIHKLLEESAEHLKRSGNVVELARTRVELARIHLRQGNRAEALKHALQAWDTLSGFDPKLFPEDLRPLLRSHGAFAEEPRKQENVMELLMESIENLFPLNNPDELLTRLIASTSRYFEAERGALLWSVEAKKVQRLSVRALFNMTVAEIEGPGFRDQLALIHKAFKHGEPLMLRLDNTDPRGATSLPVSTLCIPLESHGQMCGVLYYGNSYTETMFASLDRATLKRLSKYISGAIERIDYYAQLMAKRDSIARQELSTISQAEGFEIIAESPAMLQLLQRAEKVAFSDAPALVLGETGVGKELLARWLHAMSPRKGGPFIVIDPGSMPENLVESELFGHEKGSFTGADRQKQGRMELAQGGTLFIDEVGEIPLSIQTKLLRVLQEQTLMRVGGMRAIQTDFRLLAATNRDLAAEVAARTFREDLFYRLNVVPLTIPPLRDRGDDIIKLAQYFLTRSVRKNNRPELWFSAEDKKRLKSYPWPGNVRELKNVIERAVILSGEGRLELSLHDDEYKEKIHDLPDNLTLQEMERRYIGRILEKSHGKIYGPRGAAEILGMHPSTLNSRIRKLGIK